jgi:hypothetical protein
MIDARRDGRSGPWMTALARPHPLRMAGQEVADSLVDLSDAAICPNEAITRCPSSRPDSERGHPPAG